MLEAALRICEAAFGVLFRYDGDGRFHGAAWRVYDNCFLCQAV